MGLSDEFKKAGVPQDSPPDEDGNPSGDPAEQPDGTAEERPSENFYREALRKQEQSNKQMLDKLDQGFNRLADVLTPAQSTPTAEPAAGNHPFDRFSIQDITAALTDGRIPDNEKPGVQLYLTQRIAKETSQTVAQETVQARTAETESARLRRESLDKAINLYPDIDKPGSQFYKAVDEEMKRRGDAWIDSNPMAILDAAYAVAARTNVKPAERLPSGRPANRGDNAAPVAGSEEVVHPFGSDAERDAIEGGLAEALGTDENGKPKKFDRKNIDAAHAYYQGNRALYGLPPKKG